MSDTDTNVSILIPSYNHGTYIERTIRSVWGQCYANSEIVIVDDGSTDNSYEIAARLAESSPIPMKVIKQKNRGICGTLNRALDISTGQIISLIASDDVMLPNRINTEIQWFKERPNLKVLYSSGQFQSEGKTFGNVHKHIRPFLKRGIVPTRNHLLSTAPGLYIQAMLIKKNFLLSIGAFDEETGSDDWSLNIRIFKTLTDNEEFIFLDRFAFLYQLHEEQSHRTSTFMTPMKRRVVRKFFSIDNRSKFLCKNYVRRSVELCSQLQFKLGLRYIHKAIIIGFSKGIPLKCLMQYSFELPSYAYRILARRLKLTVLSPKERRE